MIFGKIKFKTFLLLFVLLAAGLVAFTIQSNLSDDAILSYSVNPETLDLKFYWKDENGSVLKNFQNLKAFVERKNKKLLFAMNGGMYKQDKSPQGLYIEQKKTITPLDTSSGAGNFYMKPNGVFYLTSENKPVICTTTNFKPDGNISYATQSGPMLIIDGEIHSAFKKDSKNLNLRNGVGILPNNDIIFAMSKKEINFYDFATYFRNLGCKNALYLDGFVSRVYLPEKNWIQTDGNFGVIIGVTTP